MCECVWGDGGCVRACVRVCVRAYVQMHVCMSANVFVCVCVHPGVHLCVVYVACSRCVCVHACVHAGTCMRYAFIRPIQHGMIIVSMAVYVAQTNAHCRMPTHVFKRNLSLQ